MASQLELRDLIAKGIQQEQNCTTQTARSKAASVLHDYNANMGSGLTRLVNTALTLGCAVTLTFTPLSDNEEAPDADVEEDNR